MEPLSSIPKTGFHVSLHVFGFRIYAHTDAYTNRIYLQGQEGNLFGLDASLHVN